jgi:hypothetical protein
MGKMNWIKRMIRKLTSQRIKLEERYTLNRKYLGRSQELKRFIEERQYHCEMLGIKFSVIEDDFPDCQYGKVELVRNNKVVESAKLMRSKHNLIYWKFNE